MEQTSSKLQASIELAQAGLLEPRPWLKCRPTLRLIAHKYRSSNCNPPARLISMLISIECPASCWMYAQSCKHPIRPRTSSFFYDVACQKLLKSAVIKQIKHNTKDKGRNRQKDVDRPEERIAC